MAECFIVFVNILIEGTPYGMHFDDNGMIQFHLFIRLLTCVNTRIVLSTYKGISNVFHDFFTSDNTKCDSNSLVNIFVIDVTIFLEYESCQWRFIHFFDLNDLIAFKIGYFDLLGIQTERAVNENFGESIVL